MCFWRRRERQRRSPVELQAYDQTGAAKEHIGFGKYDAQAKDCAEIFFFASLGQTAEDRQPP